MGSQEQAQFKAILLFRSAIALEQFNDFRHLQCVSDMASQGLVHVGDQGPDLLPHLGADGNHHLRQFLGIGLGLHEGPLAGFDIEHQSIDSLRQFFTHDAG